MMSADQLAASRISSAGEVGQAVNQFMQSLLNPRRRAPEDDRQAAGKALQNAFARTFGKDVDLNIEELCS